MRPPVVAAASRSSGGQAGRVIGCTVRKSAACQRRTIAESWPAGFRKREPAREEPNLFKLQAEASDDCKPGDHCPSCGTYLHYEDTDEGRVKAPLAFSSVGIPAGIASLVYAMAVGIARIGMRPKKR